MEEPTCWRLKSCSHRINENDRQKIKEQRKNVTSNQRRRYTVKEGFVSGLRLRLRIGLVDIYEIRKGNGEK